MPSSRNIPWKRIIIESIAIVGSILLAFAIDAWWEARQESKEAKRVLEAVKTELEQNVEEIDQELGYRDALNVIIQEILLASGDESSVTPERADSLLASLLWYGVIEFQSGALDSLIQGGRLAIIDDYSIRLSLAGLPESYANTRTLEMPSYNFVLNTLNPFVIENTFFPQVALMWSEGRPGIGGGTDQHPLTYPARPASDHRALLSDPTLLGYVVMLKGMNDDASHIYRMLQSELETAIELIAEELD